MQSANYNSDVSDPYLGPLDASYTDKLAELVKQNHRILWVAFQHDGSSFQQSPGSKRWVIVTDQGIHPHGIDPLCVAMLANYHAAGHEILCVAFTVPSAASPSGWAITTDQTIFTWNLPADCAQKMKELDADGHKLLCVAFTGGSLPFGSANKWSIITDKPVL